MSYRSPHGAKAFGEATGKAKEWAKSFSSSLSPRKLFSPQKTSRVQSNNSLYSGLDLNAGMTPPQQQQQRLLPSKPADGFMSIHPRPEQAGLYLENKHGDGDLPETARLLGNGDSTPNYSTTSPERAGPERQKSVTDFEEINEVGASSLATAFGLLKSIVGGGVLTLPWAYAQAGWLTCLIAQLVIVAINYYTFIILAYHAEIDGKPLNFRQLCKRSGGGWISGKKLAATYDVVVVLLLSIASLAYIIFISDCLIDFMMFFTDADFVHWRKLWVTVIVIVLFPLSLRTNLNALKYSSVVGVIALAYLGVLMVVSILNPIDAHVETAGLKVEATKSATGLCLFFAISSATYNAHFNSPEFYKELRDRSFKKYATICAFTFLVVIIFNTLIGLCGYFLVGDGVQQNILNSLPNTISEAFARLAVGISVTGSYPLIFQATRSSLLSLMSTCWPLVNRDKATHKKFVVGMTFALGVVFWILGLFVTSVGLVISLAQSLGGCAIAYVFPVIIHYQLSEKKTALDKYWLLLLSTVIVFIGVFGSIANITWVIANWSGAQFPPS